MSGTTASAATAADVKRLEDKIDRITKDFSDFRQEVMQAITALSAGNSAKLYKSEKDNKWKDLGPGDVTLGEGNVVQTSSGNFGVLKSAQQFYSSPTAVQLTGADGKVVITYPTADEASKALSTYEKAASSSTTTTTTTTTSSFVFKPPQEDTSASSFSFASSSAAGATSSSSFTFGGAGSTSSFASFGGGGAFGGTGASTGFSFTAPAATAAAPTSTADEDDNDEESRRIANGEEGPAIQDGDAKFSAVETSTGQEDDDIVTAVRSAVFVFDATNGEWKERGRGELTVLRNAKTGASRLLLRQDSTLKVRLNHSVYEGLAPKHPEGKEKQLAWTAVQDCSDVGNMDFKEDQRVAKDRTCCAKFNAAAHAKAILQAIVACQAATKPGPSPVIKAEEAQAKPAAE